MEIYTTKLHGKKVLAMAICGGDSFSPIGYANMTQASDRVRKLRERGVESEVIGQRPYYIHILN